jgi:hypothetical protein
MTRNMMYLAGNGINSGIKFNGPRVMLCLESQYDRVHGRARILCLGRHGIKMAHEQIYILLFKYKEDFESGLGRR